jgi:alpha-1,2-mannosyltransferase
LTVSLSAVGALGLWARGGSAVEISEAIGSAHALKLLDEVAEDSWWPMLEAYQLKAREPATDMYRVFFEERVKFQYPPTSLLTLDLMPRAVTGYDPPSRPYGLAQPLQTFITWPSRLAVVLTILCAYALLERSLWFWQVHAAQRSAVARAHSGRWWRAACALLLGLTYYPLLKSYELGQIQVFLNAFVALALLLQLYDKPLTAGAVIGLCALVKPQYGVVLMLACLLREWRYAAGFSGTFVSGLLLSIWRFGLHDHVRYLDVLKFLSRRGETYWPNQSVNGLVNRFIGNGDAVNWMENDFPPYMSGVYLASVVSAAVLMLTVLWSQRRACQLPRVTYANTVATALMIAAATIGSPVAWEHHYGTFLAMFALALPAALGAQPWGRWTGMLTGLSYVAMSNALLRPELIFRNHVLGLAGSHLFFGALLLFGLLLSAAHIRQRVADAVAVTSARSSVHS